MAINATVTRRVDGGWSWSWIEGSSAELPYSIYLDGLLIATVSTPAYDDFFLPFYELDPPDLEIVPASGSADGLLYPPFIYVQWRGNPEAGGYVVEQLDASASVSTWVERCVVRENGSSYYVWRSLAQEDQSSQTFRVTAVSVAGSPGVPIPSTFEICRNPPHPAVEFEITSAGTVAVIGV